MIPAEAVLQIRKLVSGLPRHRGKRRTLIMLKAYQGYFDASAKGDPRLLVLAGYVAPAEIWEGFNEEWQVRLDQAGIEAFKMNEWSKQHEIAGYFYRVLEEKNVPISISCVIRTDEMIKVIRSIKWPSILVEDEAFENPYFFAFKSIVGGLAHGQRKFGITEPIDLIYDEEAEKSRTIAAWDLLKLSAPPELRSLLGDTPSYKDDKKVLPLQAADLLAWRIRKWELEGTNLMTTQLPFPWGMKKDIPRLHMEFRESHFREEFEEMLKPHNLAHAIANVRSLKIPPDRLTVRRVVKMTIPDPSSSWNWKSSAEQVF